jgi:hypothetical protein
LKGKDYLENLDVDKRILLKHIFEKQGRRCRLDSFGSRQGPVTGCFHHGTVPLGFHKRQGIS